MDYSLLLFILYDPTLEEKFPCSNPPLSFCQRKIKVGKMTMNRYISVGIIDYLTNFNLLKVMEEAVKKTYQVNPSAVKPQLYRDRFVKQCDRMFGASVGPSPDSNPTPDITED